MSLVTFALRAGDDAAAALLARVNGSGAAFLSHARVAGRHALRLAIGGTLTDRKTVAAVWEVLRTQDS